MKKKDIIQLVKKLVKEDAYGSATLTTQGAPRTRAIAPAGEDPYTGRVEYPYTVGAKTKNGMMEKENLKEFTSMGQEGIYPRREEPGDMFQQKEVEDLLPNGMASRNDREFQARLKQHADWTEESGYNNTFVHIQYHDSFNREHSYRIHQSQNYNGNYKDFRNPKFTVLTITKKKEGKEEELGRYIVDTDAYLKDFAKLRNDGVLGKQVSENKEIDEIKVNYDFSEKELVRIVKQLKRGASTEVDMIKAFEKALGREITDKELFKEAPMFKTDVKQDMAPEGMAGRIKSVFNKVKGAQDPVKTPEWHKNRFKSKYGISFPEELKGINKDQAIAMNKYANDMIIKEDISDEISKAEDEVQAATQTKADAEVKVAAARKKKADGEKSALEEDENLNNETMDNTDNEGRMAKSQMYKMKDYVDKLSMMMDDGAQLPSWVQSKLTKASDYMSAVFHYLEYEAVRGQDNLMEHVDKYKKRALLMEGAMKKFFEMFDMGKTDEEIIQDYAQRGTQVPETFVGKARKQYEGLKKMKLELEMSEKEYKNSATQIVNNPATGEMDGSTTMETKQLSTDLFNEELDPVGQEDDDVNNDGKVDKTDKYLKNKRAKTSKAINKNKTK